MMHYGGKFFSRNGRLTIQRRTHVIRGESDREEDSVRQTRDRSTSCTVEGATREGTEILEVPVVASEISIEVVQNGSIYVENTATSSNIAIRLVNVKHHHHMKACKC